MSTEDDPQALRERVREQHARIEALEQTVADLQDSDGDTATSTRRSILASAAAAAGLGSLGTYGVRRASAQASGPAGQQGTASAPNDMYAWDLDVQGQVTRDIDFGGHGVTNGGSFDVEAAEIVGETDIKANLTTDKSSIASGTWTTIPDTEIKDNLDEQDGSFNINPSETGEYRIDAVAWFDAPSDGDRVEIAIRDADADTTLSPQGRNRRAVGGTSTQSITLSTSVEMSAGTNYQIQARNINSSFTLRAFNSEPGYVVKREVVDG